MAGVKRAGKWKGRWEEKRGGAGEREGGAPAIRTPLCKILFG